MTEDRLDKLIQTAAETYNVPPVNPPLDTMWTAIENEHFGRSITPAPLVGALMNVDVLTVGAATPIVELVPVFANYGHHHIPVLDGNQRLAGMITQADLIAGLYRQAYARQQHAA